MFGPRSLENWTSLGEIPGRKDLIVFSPETGLAWLAPARFSVAARGGSIRDRFLLCCGSQAVNE